MELTDKQLDILYQIVEVHLEWFNLYNPEANISYEDVLRINHQKLTDIIESCDDCDEEMINFIFETMLVDYIKMLDGHDEE